MTRQEIEELIYGKQEQQRRFTQDFPILPDVWIAYAEHPKERAEHPKERIELLLTPHTRSDAATLTRALRDRLNQEQPAIEHYRVIHPPRAEKFSPLPRILFNESVVFANFTFEELIRVAMPLTDWWKSNVAKTTSEQAWSRNAIRQFVETILKPTGKQKLPGGDPRLLRKLIAIVGAIECDRYEKPCIKKGESEDTITQAQVDAFSELLEGLTTPTENRGLLYGVSRNREANTSIWRSRMAVKADAAARVFEVDTSGIRWAVLDVGIDATHKAFACRQNGKIIQPNEELDENGRPQFASRVVRTYDFLRIKELLDPTTDIPWKGTYTETLDQKTRDNLIADLRHNLDSGRALDWDLIEPFLRIPHVAPLYDAYRQKLTDSHGTHVAGIIAANWPEAKETSLEKELYGICPDLELCDLRVLGIDPAGNPADEFTVIAALQFVGHLNAHKDLMAIHGVNLSMAVVHDVANYACGRTPVCEECERVVANGVVVVSAAGNRGFNKLASPEDGAMGDYRYISITDPGNAENVLTVGSTHRFMPHNYGVSYFSSRGPTGDGRTKPDLVAPGERIDSCAPGDGFETMDGTSMAAPHVSGAAALLIARHRELIGQPKRVKDILCKSATDLGREPRFQGAGVLDVLRAMQSV
ncbi:MAG: S8 family serine peptidase [Terriglobia bacterium]